MNSKNFHVIFYISLLSLLLIEVKAFLLKQDTVDDDCLYSCNLKYTLMFKDTTCGSCLTLCSDHMAITSSTVHNLKNFTDNFCLIRNNSTNTVSLLELKDFHLFLIN